MRAPALIAALAMAGAAHAERLPATAYRVDITASGAIADDGLPDTAAIRTALQKWPAKDTTVFVPCGTFEANDILEWKTATGVESARITLKGESKGCSVLKLQPGSAGYGNPAVPKAFIWTGSLNSSGVEAFQNNIVDLTIDCRGNAGARCVDFLANNQGRMYNVDILSDGPAALYLGRAFPGPALIQNVRTFGGSRGFALNHPQYSMTFLDVEAYDYTVAGLDVAGNVAFVDGFVASSTVAAAVPITGANGAGYLALFGAQLQCADPARSAIEVHAGLPYVLRDVSTWGCASALKDGATVVAGATIGELASAAVIGNDTRTLNLPRVSPPAAFWSAAASDWANPLTYGAVNGVGGEGNEDRVGIQAAMNSGKPAVFYPKKTSGDRAWWTLLSGVPITIPRSVELVDMGGIEHQILYSAYQSAGSCVYRIDEGTAADPPLVIRYFRRAGGVSILPGNYFCVTSRRTVVFEQVTSASILASGPGDVFAVDFSGFLTAEDGKHLYAWQHNAEGSAPPGTTFVRGQGTTARIIGEKGERDFPVLDCRDGAQCEMYAFEMPCVGKGAASVTSTWFNALHASMSVSGVEYCGGTTTPAPKLYPLIVQHDGVQVLPAATLDLGGIRRVLPLYSGHSLYEVHP